MIDCENEVFTRIATILRNSYPGGINVDSTYVNAPSSFPHVSIEMTDSYPEDMTNSLEENMTRVTFTVNVYSNKPGSRKTQAKAISNTINDAFAMMNFVRLSQIPVPNMMDETIYRITSMYAGKTDGEFFYRVY